MKNSVQNKFQKGFTLIELLVVIAILGVLAVGVILAINPVDKINAANDTKVQGDITAVGKAVEAYAVKNNGIYPATWADITATELKSQPTPPANYTYTITNVPASCVATVPPPTGSTNCTGIIISGTLKSDKFTKAPATPFFVYDSGKGRANACATGTVGC